MSSHETSTVTLPEGCYYGAALINNPQKPSKAFGDQMCVDNSGTWTITVGTEVVRVSPP